MELSSAIISADYLPSWANSVFQRAVRGSVKIKACLVGNKMEMKAFTCPIASKRFLGFVRKCYDNYN